MVPVESSSGGTGEYALSIDGITVSDVTSKGYTITVRFTSSAGVSKVLMPTWSDENGQDDPKWCEASISGSEASYTVKVSDFKAAYGKYITHVYVYDKLGKYVLKGVNVTVPGEDPADEGGNGSGENGSQSGSGENGEQNGSGEESWVYQGVDYSLVFDADYYLTHYPDLKKVYGNDHQKAFSHFIRHGMREGRQGSAIFNVNVYRSRYADLNAAFGNQLERYYLHFINNGYKENRKAV